MKNQWIDRIYYPFMFVNICTFARSNEPHQVRWDKAKTREKPQPTYSIIWVLNLFLTPSH
jgi:hypothetical protein